MRISQCTMLSSKRYPVYYTCNCRVVETEMTARDRRWVRPSLSPRNCPCRVFSNLRFIGRRFVYASSTLVDTISSYSPSISPVYEFIRKYSSTPTTTSSPRLVASLFRLLQRKSTRKNSSSSACQDKATTLDPPSHRHLGTLLYWQVLPPTRHLIWVHSSLRINIGLPLSNIPKTPLHHRFRVLQHMIKDLLISDNVVYLMASGMVHAMVTNNNRREEIPSLNQDLTTLL